VSKASDTIAAFGKDGVYVQHGANNCRHCGTWHEPFWRVEGGGGGRRVSFSAVDSVEEARTILPTLQAENPELTDWEIVKFEPVIHMTVEPLEAAGPVTAQ
jgi:hypothetical protein